MWKPWLKRQLQARGYELRRLPVSDAVPDIPDRAFYTPLFSPWLGYGEFRELYDIVRPYAWMSAQSCYVLATLASQALALRGEFWECGVYRGGSALMLSTLITSRGQAEDHTLRLFDTFAGMPEVDPARDLHAKGDFGDTSVAEVRARVPGRHVVLHPGIIPDTFRGLEDRPIAFAHIDVDIYQSISDCCEFIYPRLAAGGFMVFDDYGYADCPGARQAVDEFFRDRPEVPLVLPTSQAIVFRACHG